ncbi:Metacaspase-1B [Colletotrichum spinosum]|uniref:Metacaspase-1B n=1 Tax=Colletotrichum spinosum TaxID=1347390 RepID=A0A4R8PWI8_9PEZI|nr:Metacaspase-1B [Colletotrichum spinosum]
MSGYPGHYGGYQGGPPPQQQYATQGGYYPPPQQGYGGYPPQGSGYNYQQPSPQPYGYNQPSPQQQYGNYHQPQSNHNNRPGMPTATSNAYMHGNHNAPPPPPSAPQQFGHGAPNNYNFQYSNCSGRRKALLIGINYFGHGGQTKDLDGDEDDGYDEVIYPVDFRQTGHITDDEMHRIMVQPLQAGVRLTAIFDSCHSGTALDLPYIYSTQGILKEPNLAKEAGQGLIGAISSYTQGDLGGVASNIMGFFKKATTGEDAHNRAMATKTSPADVIMFSGSKDDQTSADATIAAQATGAMSWAFITALKKNPQQSYVQLLNSIRDELATRYTQKPQLSCSHPLNTNLLFVM